MFRGLEDWEVTVLVICRMVVGGTGVLALLEGLGVIDEMNSFQRVRWSLSTDLIAPSPFFSAS